MTLFNFLFVLSLFSRSRSQQCRGDEFICPYKGKPACTPNKWKCDTLKDCDDNQDESDCGGKFKEPSWGGGGDDYNYDYNDNNNDGGNPTDNNDPGNNGPTDNNDPGTDNNGPYDNYGGNGGDNGGCPQNEFKCPWNGKPLCTPNKWKCDGYKDCDNWEDETNCNGGGQGFTYDSDHTRDSRTGGEDPAAIIALVAVSIVLVLAIVGAVLYYLRRKQSTKSAIPTEEDDADIDTKGLRSNDQMMGTNPMDMTQELENTQTRV